MEKRSIAYRSVLFILTGVLVSVCMIMNWFPVDLDLGAVQLEEVFGKVNALTLSGTVTKIEESLGAFAGFLPEEFETLKVKSTILTLCAYATITCYVVASALHILKKQKFADVASFISAVLSIVTAVTFRNLMSGIYAFTVSSAAGNIAYDIIMKSPCLAVLIGGIVSALCIEKVADWIVDLVTGVVKSIAATVMNIVSIMVDFVVTIVGNVWYVLSDFAGAILGILAGAKIMAMTDSTLLGVLVGLGVAGIVAAVCLAAVNTLFYRNR